MNFNEYIDAVARNMLNCEDLIVYKSKRDDCDIGLVFIRGITSRDYIAERILRPIKKADFSSFSGDFSELIESPFLSDSTTPENDASSIVKGDVLVLIGKDGRLFKTLSNAAMSHTRAVSEPSSDVTVRGPKAGFVEDAETNISLIRRYIRTSELRTERLSVGSVSQTKLMLCYIEGRADAELVSSIRDKLARIDASVITDSANIAFLLEGRKNAIFPSCGSSEKVDKVASKIMAGRVAIVVDGSPFVLTLPFLFIEGIQASDDYLHTPYYATFIRLLRLFAFIAAIFAPAVLCAVINHNPHVMPYEFYGIIIDSRKDIPLSFFWEIMAILLLFELLREVGVRMPRTVGDAVGIVGSIILGNTAVEAGIVSSVGVITVALAAVCAFITPAYMYFIVLARLAALISAELFGVWGIAISALILFLMLCFKRSFSYYYLQPIIPFSKSGMLDFVLCYPKKTLGRREDLKKEKKGKIFSFFS